MNIKELLIGEYKEVGDGLHKLKGHRIFGEPWQSDDIFYYAAFITNISIGKFTDDDPNIDMTLHPFSQRDFDRLNEEYEFLEMAVNNPRLIEKKLLNEYITDPKKLAALKSLGYKE